MSTKCAKVGCRDDADPVSGDSYCKQHGGQQYEDDMETTDRQGSAEPPSSQDSPMEKLFNPAEVKGDVPIDQKLLQDLIPFKSEEKCKEYAMILKKNDIETVAELRFLDEKSFGELTKEKAIFRSALAKLRATESKKGSPVSSTGPTLPTTGIVQQLSSLSLSFSTNDFIETMKKLLSHSTLEKQQQLFGNLLKNPLPLSSDLENLTINSFLLKQIGDTKFTTELLTATKSSNLQNRKIMAIANSSGSGKTKLCISFGMDSNYTLVLIRFQTNNRKSKSLEILIDWFYEIKSKPTTLYQKAKDALNALRLFIFAHFQWIRKVLEAQKTFKEIPDSFQKELCIRALENGYGESAVECIFGEWKNQYSHLDKNFLEPLFNGIIKALPQKVAVAYDEIAALKGMYPGLFFHETDFASGDPQTAEYEQNRGVPLGDRSQVADAFYGIRLVMKELLDFHSYPQIMADSHLSIWNVEYDRTSSPLRSRLQKWTKLHRFTIQDMVQCLSHYWSLGNLSTEVKQCLQRFEGRAIFFCDHLLVKLVDECAQVKPSTHSDFEKIIKNITETQFERCVSVLQEPVQRVIKNTSSLSPSLPTMQQIMFSIYSSIYLSECKYTLQHDEHLRELVTCGIFAPDSIESNLHVIDLQGEPVLFEAVKQVGDNLVRRGVPNEDPVFSVLNARFSLANDPASSKGRAGEDALSWFLIRQFIIKDAHELTLQDLLGPLLATPLTDNCAYLKVQLKYCKTGEFPQCLLESDVLWQKIPVNAGPDHAFSLLSNAGTLVIQAKAQQDKSLDLADALRSVDPALLYTTVAQRNAYKLKKHPIQNPWTSCHLLRQASYDFLKQYPHMLTPWIRCLFSVAPFNKDLVKKVGKYNKDTTGSPLFLLQGSADCFGSYLHSNLVKNCGSKEIGGSASLGTVSLEGFHEFEQLAKKHYQNLRKKN